MTSTRPSTDRRVSKRFDVAGDVHGHVRHALDLRVQNISLTGLAVSSDRPLRVGHHYRVRIETTAECIEVDAIVVWCHLEHSTEGPTAPLVYQAGLDFRHAVDHQIDDLRHLLDHAAVIRVERRIFGRFRPRPGTDAKTVVEDRFALRRLSFSGMLIESESAPAIGAEVEFVLEPSASPIRGHGRVTHVEPRETGHLVGIAFNPLAPQHALVLTEFIEELAGAKG